MSEAETIKLVEEIDEEIDQETPTAKTGIGCNRHDERLERYMTTSRRLLQEIDHSTCQLAITFPPAATLRNDYLELWRYMERIRLRLEMLNAVRVGFCK